MSYRRKKRKGRHSKRMSPAKRNFQERAGWKNRHHIKNKCRRGDSSPQNILMMDERRHAAFHLLFRNMDFLQVANLLLRCYCMKNKQEKMTAHIVYMPIVEVNFDGIGIA